MVGLVVKCSAVAFLFLIFGHSASAVQSSSQQIYEEYESEKKNLEETQELQRDLLAELYKIKRRMREIEKERGILDIKKTSASDNISSLTSILETLEKKVDRQKRMVRKRIRALYKFGGKGFLKVAFESENPATLDQNLKILRRITEKDYHALSNYKKNIEVLQKKRVRLSKQNKVLKTFNAEISSKESALSKQFEKKRSLLNSLEAQETLALANIKRLKMRSRSVLNDSEKRKLEMLNELLDPAFFELRGQLDWPVDGVVVASFGESETAEPNISLNNEGIFIETSGSKKVQAVFQGEVEYVGFIPLYGRTVIINHGDRYSSVYSNLDSVKVKTGDAIQTGNMIGTTATNFSGRRGLNFQVRHFSEPLNPSQWLTR